MKVVKLLENIAKGKLESNTRIKIDNGIEIIYKYYEDIQKHCFHDITGKEVDIMNFFFCDFEPVVEKEKKDIWDEVHKALNSNSDNSSNIEKGIGISNETSFKIPKFSLSLLEEKKTSSDGICLFYDDLSDYSYETNQTIGFYNTAEGYYDAALVMIENYENRFERVFDLGNLNKNAFSFGYYQDSIIRTLLAFSCECYLKCLLLNQGKSLKDIKKLNHGLVDLYHALDNYTFAEIFLDMERNGYNIKPYNSPKLPYDNPDLTEKFMVELGLVDDAFIESRYCAEKDKNTNYGFLYSFVKSLKNVTDEQIGINSIFNDGKYKRK